MKRFLTCALCFIPMSAMCDVTLWYDKSGTCTGLHVSNSCSSEKVTRLNVTPMADSTFDGFFVTVPGYTSQVQIVYGNGVVANNVAEILSAANLSSTNRTLTQTTTCNGNLDKNSNGICVDTSGNITYVDFESGYYFDSNYELSIPNGYEVSPSDIGSGPGGRGGQYYSNFIVELHWCPEPYEPYQWFWRDSNTPSGWSQNDAPSWPGMTSSNCTSVKYKYEWARGDSAGHYYSSFNQTTGQVTDTNSIVDKLYVPTWSNASNNGWTLRGFYLLNYPSMPSGGCPLKANGYANFPTSSSGSYSPPTNFDECRQYYGYRNSVAKNIVTYEDSSWGTARLGLTKKMVDGTYPTNYIPLRDNGMGDIDNTNTRWAIWSTTPIKPSDVIHLYAGWAKDCEQTEGGTCNLTIKRTGLSQNNNKGDAFYTATCNNGSPLTGEGTYNPQCAAPKNIMYTYSKYSDTEGNSVTCSGGPSGGTCNTGTSFTLANPTNLSCSGKFDNTNYKFARWLTGDGELREAGDIVGCNVNVLAGWTDEDGVYKANISGIVCNCASPTVGICTNICSPADTLNLAVGFTVDENVTAAGGAGTSN